MEEQALKGKQEKIPCCFDCERNRKYFGDHADHGTWVYTQLTLPTVQDIVAMT